ncbi:MAG: molybdenum cofactor guanylyltransferase [Eubacteriales bacterium]|nr:molybdenum cofactor guanylyltransferase [Eubacteriales bacterium]
MEINRISAGILAGGKSTRMGENKARLKLNDQSFMEKIAWECRGFSELLISVDSMEKYQDIPYRMVEDELMGYGPLEGIFQLVRACTEEYIFIAATDMPFLNAEFLNLLCTQLEGTEDCLTLTKEKRPEPLCSIYSKKLLPVLQEMRAQSIRKPRLLFDRVNTRYVELEALGVSPELVSNINTPEEYCKLIQEK